MSIDAGCLCKFEFRFDRIGDVESINEDRIRFFVLFYFFVNFSTLKFPIEQEIRFVKNKIYILLLNFKSSCKSEKLFRN